MAPADRVWGPIAPARRVASHEGLVGDEQPSHALPAGDKLVGGGLALHMCGPWRQASQPSDGIPKQAIARVAAGNLNFRIVPFGVCRSFGDDRKHPRDGAGSHLDDMLWEKRR
jgi:hypothetical protein